MTGSRRRSLGVKLTGTIQTCSPLPRRPFWTIIVVAFLVRHAQRKAETGMRLRLFTEQACCNGTARGCYASRYECMETGLIEAAIPAVMRQRPELPAPTPDPSEAAFLSRGDRKSGHVIQGRARHPSCVAGEWRVSACQALHRPGQSWTSA